MFRMLSVGPMWDGSTSVDRCDALGRLGAATVRFDVTPYMLRGGLLARHFHERLLVGPNVAALNRDLVALATEQGPFDVAWIDKGSWIRPATLQALRRHCRLLVHNTPDAFFDCNRSRLFEAGIGAYDLCITNKRYELDQYREAGARDVMLLPQGVGDKFVALAGTTDIQPTPALVFMGRCEPHYVATLTALVNAGQPVHIWGPKWPQRMGRDPVLGPAIRGDAIYGEGYVRCLQRHLVGLGFLSKLNRDQFTTRSFEIPAAGRLLLAERTPDHQALFEEGAEAEFYGSTAELVEKARFYLAHPDRALAIGAAGRARVLRDYRWHQVLRPAVQRLGLATEARAAPAVVDG
jgi:hypothetical protein